MTDKAEFLVAKRAVDDLAIDRSVWQRFLTELDARTTSEPIRIVEAGAGVGTMVARLADWARLSRPIAYRAVDSDPDVIDVARTCLPTWLAELGYDVSWEGDTLVATPAAGGHLARLDVDLEVADVSAIDATADAVIGAALLDIVDQDSMVATFDDLLTPGGLVYTPLTFDGQTRFFPETPGDTRIERLYHRHMDVIRDSPAGSRAGRELLAAFRRSKFHVLASGAANWAIEPTEGEYPDGGEVVLAHLLATIDCALADYPDEVVSPSTRSAWVSTRRQQLAHGRLSAEVRHLDSLASKARP